MLQTIRDRAQGIFAWIILIMIIVPFALWGIQNYFDTGKEQPIANVGDREFFERDLLRFYEQQYAQYLGKSPYSEEELKKQALDRLIDDEVLAQAAEKKKLTVSDAQIAQFIRSLPFFQTDGKFDEEKYRSLLVAQGMSVPQFVAQVRRSLILEQLRRSIIDSSFATDPEAQQFYQLQYQTRKVAYAVLPLTQAGIQIDPQEVENYYQKHQDQFRTPEQVAIEYLTLSLDEIAKTITPSEEELRTYYEEQKQAYTTPEERRIRHILIAVTPDSPEEEKQKALEKAREIKQKLDQGADFAELAKQMSEDPGSKDKGGDLGFVRRGLMEKNFEEAAFSLPKGAVSEPVETPFGYHIMQVMEIKPEKIKPFEEVKREILQEVQKSKAEDQFYQLGEQLAQLAYENPQSLEPAAQALGLTIQKTGLFTHDKGEGMAANPKIREAAFSDEVLSGNNSEPIELEDGKIVVVRLREHQPARLKPLEKVRQTILEKLRRQKAEEQAKAQAEKLLAQLKQGKTLQDLAKHARLEIKTAQLSRSAPRADLMEIADAAFKAPKPSQEKPVFEMVILANGQPAIVQIKEVSPGDFEQLKDEEKRGLKQNLARLLGLLSFKEYQDQLRDEAEVKMNWPPKE